jgi:CO/xanthine dehydrogenase FAD-binding subunit
VLGAFDYVRVRTVEEGCLHLADAREEGAVLAGGTDLLVEIRNGLKSPRLLVDCKEIPSLHELEIQGSELRIGASAPLNLLVERPDVRSVAPALSAAVSSIGTYQLRNRATLAGNICNASPAADSAPVLLVLNAQVLVAGPTGTRTIPIRDFFLGVKRTALEPAEIVTAIVVPLCPSLQTTFHKQQRIRGHDLAVVNIAGAYDRELRTLRIAVGSCAPTPVLLEPISVDEETPHALLARVVETVRQGLSPISDVRASARYRQAVLPILVRRALDDLLGMGGGD